MTADPYPTNLDEIDESELGFAPASPSQTVILRAVTALERIATALESRQPAQNAPQRPANLAALPPVQVAQDRPVCPYHGAEKVATSTNGKGGFYCQAKAQPGQPSNPKGYCTWHT